MLLENKRIELKESNSRLGFTTTGGGAWKAWDRFITYDGEQLFHIGNVCGTCAFFFRQINKNIKTSYAIENLKEKLNHGIVSLDDDVITQLSKLLPVEKEGDKVFDTYEAMLMEITPRLVRRNTSEDYFSTEQALLWDYGDENDNCEEGEAYYRGLDSIVTATEKLFEFFIPLYQPEFLNMERVEYYRAQMRKGLKPTAISLGIIDAKESVIYDEEPEDNIVGHWSFANYMLDGHHKIYAAALENKPITLLSFVTCDFSWRVIDQLIEHYHKREIK